MLTGVCILIPLAVSISTGTGPYGPPCSVAVHACPHVAQLPQPLYNLPDFVVLALGFGGKAVTSTVGSQFLKLCSAGWIEAECTPAPHSLAVEADEATCFVCCYLSQATPGLCWLLWWMSLPAACTAAVQTQQFEHGTSLICPA
jgi:hypothetical protein